jgi:hypothetical protein
MKIALAERVPSMRTLVSDFNGVVGDLARVYHNDRRTRRVALAALAVILLLSVVPFVLDLLYRLGAPVPPLSRWLKAGSDGSLPEIACYLLAVATAWLLYQSWRLSGVRVFLAMAALFVFIAIDDSLTYHENRGEIVAEKLELTGALGLDADDVGELIAWGFAGVVLAVPILFSLRQPVPHVLGVAGVFLVSLGAIVFFEAGIDILQVSTGSWLMGYLEDSGVMLPIGLAFVCAFALYRGYSVPTLAALLHLPTAWDGTGPSPAEDPRRPLF